MRLFKRLALALIPALALVAAFPLTAAAAQVAPTTQTAHFAQTSTKPHSLQKRHKFPARGTKLNGKIVSGKDAPQGTGDLVYYGGPVLHDPKIYVIFWGSAWNSGSDVTAKQTILNFFQDVGNTRYNNLLTQYFDTSANINNDISLQASTVDTTFASTNTYCGGTTVYDHADQGDPTNIDVVDEVYNVATAHGWPLDSANGLYFVYLPSGTYLNDGSPSIPDATGCADTNYNGQGYCAYHSALGAGPYYAYAAMPYPLWTQGCGTLPAYPNGSGNVGDVEVNVSSHEMSEAITDPLPAGPGNSLTGWTDAGSSTTQSEEIGDKCAWDFSDGTTRLNNGATFEMQSEYSNASSACASNYGTPSKTWYFAEGYTGTGFAEYLTLANPNSKAANVTVNYLIQGGTPIQKTYVVNATSRRTVTVNNEIGAGHSVSMVVTSDQPIVAERPMYFTYSSAFLSKPVPGGSDVLGATSLGSNFNFGYIDTSTDHDTYLTVLNQNSSAMTVTMSYYPEAGGSAIVKTATVNGNSRGTVHVNTLGLAQGSYSVLVALDQPGLVERPMYLIDATTHNTGSADVVGVPTSSQNWYFAEGYTGATFAERYILSAPGTALSTNATVTFIDTSGNSTPVNVTIPAGGQVVVIANDHLPANTNNSAVVTASQPIIAERFMSFDYTGPVGTSPTSNIPGATDVLGSTKLATQFYFAEGYTGGSFGEYITVENANNAPTFVTFKFLPANGGAPVVIQQTINANSRFTLNVNKQAGLSGLSLSAVVQSTLPIVVERPMYYNFSGLGVSNATGGSDVIGYQP